jgi:hypothetical protein
MESKTSALGERYQASKAKALGLHHITKLLLWNRSISLFILGGIGYTYHFCFASDALFFGRTVFT